MSSIYFHLHPRHFANLASNELVAAVWFDGCAHRRQMSKTDFYLKKGTVWLLIKQKHCGKRSCSVRSSSLTSTFLVRFCHLVLGLGDPGISHNQSPFFVFLQTEIRNHKLLFYSSGSSLGSICRLKDLLFDLWHGLSFLSSDRHLCSSGSFSKAISWVSFCTGPGGRESFFSFPPSIGIAARSKDVL